MKGKQMEEQYVSLFSPFVLLLCQANCFRCTITLHPSQRCLRLGLRVWRSMETLSATASYNRKSVKDALPCNNCTFLFHNQSGFPCDAPFLSPENLFCRRRAPLLRFEFHHRDHHQLCLISKSHREKNTFRYAPNKNSCFPESPQPQTHTLMPSSFSPNQTRKFPFPRTAFLPLLPSTSLFFTLFTSQSEPH